MRGFLTMGLVLVGLDLVLTAPASRVASLFQLPAGWLASWMDPGTPLIGPGHLAEQSGVKPGTNTNTALGLIGAAGGNPYGLVGPIANAVG